MKSIPHDYYLKFIAPDVFDQVQNFHNKGNYTIHEAFNEITYLHKLHEDQLSLLSGNELALYPDMHLTDPSHLENANNLPFARNESCKQFADSKIDFESVKKLLTPLLTKNPNTHKRHYPSGGALYPVEVFICSLTDKNDDWPYPQKILHLLPASKSLEVMQTTCSTQKIRKAILSNLQDIGTPSIALVYTSYLPKTLFKYRYRGYRLALMETGSMYMLLELQVSALQLNCRLWSGYTDHMLSKAIGLNPALFTPLCVHLIGNDR